MEVEKALGEPPEDKLVAWDAALGQADCRRLVIFCRLKRLFAER
jgi:hypothetical protein